MKNPLRALLLLTVWFGVLGFVSHDEYEVHCRVNGNPGSVAHHERAGLYEERATLGMLF